MRHKVYANTIVFILFCSSLAQQRAYPGVLNIPSKIPLVKTFFFSFASRYQLCVGCWLSLRLCSLFPLRIGTSGLNMCSSYSCCCHLWIHMCIRSVLSARHCFQESALLLLALRVCLCPLLNSSCALRRACDGHIPGSAK